MKFVYLDSGIDKSTDLAVIKFIHNQFLNHHKVHTVSLLCEGLEQNMPVVNYINGTTNWELCIQGWEDIDYLTCSKEKITDDLDKCTLKVEELFNVTPEKWYINHSIDQDLMRRIKNIAYICGIDTDSRYEHIGYAVDILEQRKNLITNTVFFNSKKHEDLALLSNLFYLTR